MIRKALVVASVILSGIFASSPALAQKSGLVELEGATLKGNEENPQVLFVLPWKSEETPPIVTPEPDIDLSELLRPIERPLFKGMVQFRQERRLDPRH